MALTSTQKRLISSAAMMLTVVAVLLSGVGACHIMVSVVGLLIVHEVLVNFLKYKFFAAKYLLLISIFILPSLFFNFYFYRAELISFFVSLSILVNLVLFIYLFTLDINSKSLIEFLKKFPFIIPLFILFPSFALNALFHHPERFSLIGTLLFINYGMDSGAWFFGKKFGKHKLWPSVSPNKTIEGLIGGAITSGFLGGICHQIFFGNMKVGLFFLFVFLGIMSQIGDLIQSKIKRQFQVKDSSALIPGHGGVYDRIDSLIFLAPFFATALKYYSIN